MPNPFSYCSRAATLTALCVCCFSSGCGPGFGPDSGSTTSQVDETTEVVYTPASASGKPNLDVASTQRGECFTGSMSTARDDAWRCSFANKIEDPCFALDERSVLCPMDGPWSSSAIQLKLRTPLAVSPYADNGGPDSFWALELLDGVRCTFATGTGHVAAGLRANYTCDNKVLLYGEPDTTGALWTIRGGSVDARELKRYMIAKAWS